MNKPQACLFDLDGLLLDTEQLHSQAWKSAASYFGTSLSEKQLLLLRGRRREDCIDQVCKWMAKDIEKDKFIGIHRPISKRLMTAAKAMPGAKDLICFCYANKIPMALVTSSSASSLALKSAPHPWVKLINTLVLGDDAELKRGKPAPDPYLLAAKKLGINPKSCWAFEDSKSGTESALKAGCQVWVLIDKRNCTDQLTQNNNYDMNPKHISELIEVKKELENFLN